MHSFRIVFVTVSLALLSTAALATPVIPCHESSGSLVTLGETHDEAASLARNLVKTTGIGTFMSVMNDRQKGGTLNDYPFGSMDYYVDDCDAPGTPLMLLSSIQVNVKNAKTANRVSLAIRKLPSQGEQGKPMADPRVTLLGHLVPLDEKKHAKAEKCFVEKHPDAKWWLPRNGFHDFRWYNLEIKEIYYIGGFGGIHYIGWIDVATYYNQEQGREREDDSFWRLRLQS
ncbi:hypothetical protein BGZ49_007844 [Haplosporangium sp. Z 27]|nr:hypothetical protein BGZ49_007844 [Haplosporangium sp. Z 27]